MPVYIEECQSNISINKIGIKKLIVSRQPIFTNLKSNTMKNNAKVRLLTLSSKHIVVFFNSI